MEGHAKDAAMDEKAIRISGLTKAFGGHTAVDHLDLEVGRGELFGLVGPDGAGKTTAMRLLTAIMIPDSGEAWVAGASVLDQPERIKERIGYMSQQFGLYEDLTVMENIRFYADLYGVAHRERPARVERLLGFSGLSPFKDRLASNLSGGMKQKLGLTCALIHTPEVLFLDEPTGGVDPVSRRDLWRILYDLLREGVTIFVSTAYLDEAERCTRIGLIHRGGLLVAGEPGEVRRMRPFPMIEVVGPDIRRARDAAGTIEGVRGVIVYGDRLHLSLEQGAVIDAVVAALSSRGIIVTAQRSIRPSLEDVFIALVTEAERATKAGQDR